MALRGSRTSIRSLLVGALSFSAAALVSTSAVAPASAAESEATPATTSSIQSAPVKVRFLSLGIGKSIVAS